MDSLNLNKPLNRFLDWKITLILHCGNDLLTALYKRFLKFNKNVPNIRAGEHISTFPLTGKRVINKKKSSVKDHSLLSGHVYSFDDFTVLKPFVRSRVFI